MNKPKVHFIGIGGIGTSALARWFLSHGHKVSGSDASSSEITSDFKKQGIKIFIGHRAKNIPQEAKLVIYSEAIPADNLELKRAKSLGICVKSSSQAIGDLSEKYKTIAITGAHGKGTTTALLSLALIKAGFDPTVIIGTKLKEFGDSNFRKGSSNCLILEADEFHKKFLNYHPFAVIITNIDREHLDFYKNLKNIKSAFLKFIGNIQIGGILVINKNDKNIFSLKNKIQKIAKNNHLNIYWYGIQSKLEKILKIPGKHILSDATAVYTLAKALGVKDKDVIKAIASYNGAWRRMEYRGRAYDVPSIASIYGHRKSQKLRVDVYDDYAHHPTEIKATLTGIAQKWPKTGLICVFQPHQVQRLSLLFKDFVRAFDAANALVLLPVYQVRGRDRVSHNQFCCNRDSLCRKKLSRFCNAKNIVAKSLSAQLAQAIQKRFKTQNLKLKTIIYLPSSKKLPKVIKEIITEKFLYPKPSTLNAIIVMMGAGDIYHHTKRLLTNKNKLAK